MLSRLDKQSIFFGLRGLILWLLAPSLGLGVCWHWACSVGRFLWVAHAELEHAQLAGFFGSAISWSMLSWQASLADSYSPISGYLVNCPDFLAENQSFNSNFHRAPF